MRFVDILLYFFMGVALLSVFGIFLTKNVFKGALYLLTCLLCIAALYVINFADFVAVTQIMVYAGGIVVVMIFGIMLTTKISGKPLLVTNTNIFSGSLVSFALFALLINIISDHVHTRVEQALTTENNISAIGINLMTSHALPFEVTGVLLLVALVGAAVVTSFMKSNKV